MDIKAFITGGNATFTLTSHATGVRYTYKAVASKDGRVTFISVLTGPDNTEDFSYAGVLRISTVGHLSFNTGAKSFGDLRTPSLAGFNWLVGMLNRGLSLEGKADFHHAGKCGRCGRELTVPESIESGFGPTCIGKVGG